MRVPTPFRSGRRSLSSSRLLMSSANRPKAINAREIIVTLRFIRGSFHPEITADSRNISHDRGRPPGWWYTWVYERIKILSSGSSYWREVQTDYHLNGC